MVWLFCVRHCMLWVIKNDSSVWLVKVQISPLPVWALRIIQLITPWWFCCQPCEISHFMYTQHSTQKRLKASPTQIFVVLFLYYTPVFESLSYNYSHLLLPKFLSPSFQFSKSASLLLSVVHNWLWAEDWDIHRIHRAHLSLSLFSRITVICCLLSNVWKQLFHLFYPIF